MPISDTDVVVAGQIPQKNPVVVARCDGLCTKSTNLAEVQNPVVGRDQRSAAANQVDIGVANPAAHRRRPDEADKNPDLAAGKRSLTK